MLLLKRKTFDNAKGNHRTISAFCKSLYSNSHFVTFVDHCHSSCWPLHHNWWINMKRSMDTLSLLLDTPIHSHRWTQKCANKEHFNSDKIRDSHPHFKYENVSKLMWDLATFLSLCLSICLSFPQPFALCRVKLIQLLVCARSSVFIQRRAYLFWLVIQCKV